MADKSKIDIDEIQKRCESLSDETYLKNTLTLIPTDWKMIGVKTADMRKLASEYAKGIAGNTDFNNIMDYLDKAFELKNLTLVAVGLEIINIKSEFLKPAILKKVKMWIPSISDWAVADGMAITITSSLLEKDLISLNDLEFLKNHTNVFGRRIYITSMVLPIRKDSCDINLFLSEIERYIGDKNKYIYKAVSWVLREGTRKFKGRISSFVEQHKTELHSSVVREVLNKIETGNWVPTFHSWSFSPASRLSDSPRFARSGPWYPAPPASSEGFSGPSDWWSPRDP